MEPEHLQFNELENQASKNEADASRQLQSVPPTILPVKPAWHQLKEAWGNYFGTLRHNSVSATPRHIVNNSSNILGFTHVLTEVMMFKSSLKGGKLVDEYKNPIDFAWRAAKRVVLDSLRGSTVADPYFKEIIKQKPLTGFFHYIGNTKAATEFEFNLQNVSPDKFKLGNPWQTRSTLAGLFVWALSTVLPDRRESEDEVERMAILAATDKPRYVLERFKQAVWVPGWLDHKRQMIGLGIMASGIFSGLGAWRNYVKDPKYGLKYEFNPGYFMTSMITFAASLPLLFASDDQRGFGGFGSVMMGRLLFLPSSIYKKIKGGEKGASWYMGATASFQAENIAQALVGGAEKLPDGSIIDHHALREEAHRKIAEIKAGHAATSDAVENDSAIVPTTKLTKVETREAAMPDRASAHQEAALVSA